MLTLLSPAKKLLTIEKPYEGSSSLPLFQSKAKELATLMKSKSCQDIANLMHLSKPLAQLNYQRYHDFGDATFEQQSYPALFLFQGDVYQGLKAINWDDNSIAFSQNHLLILSGLYGLLRPLDLIQPYRLEMGTKLINSAGKNLYDFWIKSIANELNQQLAKSVNPILLNLASDEYFKAVDVKAIKFPIVKVHFKEQTNSVLKVIGIHAKKARGALASYLIQHQLDDVESVKQFNGLNYRYCESKSDQHNLVFIRADYQSLSGQTQYC